MVSSMQSKGGFKITLHNDHKLLVLKENYRRKKRLYGVPQGSILGPLLFLIHINDVHLHIENSNTIMYADDTVLFFSDKTEAEINKAINYDADFLHTWLCNNGLILNSNRGKLNS